jgi:hypothetical protein
MYINVYIKILMTHLVYILCIYHVYRKILIFLDVRIMYI